MDTIQVEVLASDINAMVIQTPGRKYPGSVIQGDSLHYLVRIAQEIKTSAQQNKLDAVVDLANELAELLSSRLSIYETALEERGLGRPY